MRSATTSGWLDDVRRRVDDPGDEYLPSREPHVLPYFPLLLMAPIRPHDRQGRRPRREQNVDDVSERHVVVVWCLTGTPAHVHTDALWCNVAGGSVKRRDVLRHNRAELRDGEIGKPGATQGQVGTVELQEKTGLDDSVVLLLHHLCHGFQVCFAA